MRSAWNKGMTVVDWDRKVDEVLAGRFELVSRIVRDNGLEPKLIIRCTKCGTEKEISSVSLRHKGGQAVRCHKCFADQCRAKQEAKRDFEKWQKELQREADRNHKSIQTSFGFCECGEILKAGRRVCDRCKAETKRKIDRRKEFNRRTRTQGFDKDITLDKLYERDHGICYLCHRVCDWGDFQKVNGVFIVGGSYPTVEHIQPLCKGGKHIWQNVKLACHSCNSKKGARLPESLSPL